MILIGAFLLIITMVKYSLIISTILGLHQNGKLRILFSPLMNLLESAAEVSN